MADCGITQRLLPDFGEHHGFVVINRRIKTTPEHPILIRRGDE